MVCLKTSTIDSFIFVKYHVYIFIVLLRYIKIQSWVYHMLCCVDETDGNMNVIRTLLASSTCNGACAITIRGAIGRNPAALSIELSLIPFAVIHFLLQEWTILCHDTSTWFRFPVESRIALLVASIRTTLVAGDWTCNFGRIKPSARFILCTKSVDGNWILSWKISACWCHRISIGS